MRLSPTPSRTPAPVAALRAAALVVALAACSARAAGGSTSTTGGDAGGSTSPSTLSFTCAQLCAPLGSAASCGSGGVASCMAQCDGAIASTPSACVGSANALYDCTRTAAAQCSSSSAFPFPSCMSVYGAYLSCVSAPPPVDAGAAQNDSGAPRVDAGGSTDECATAADCAACTARSSCGWCAGRCWTGSSSGPSAGSCGDSSWAWTSNQCSAAPRDAGAVTIQCQQCAVSRCPSQVQACMADPACLACVVAPSPSCAENPGFAAVAECACGGCAETCGPLCSGF